MSLMFDVCDNCSVSAARRARAEIQPPNIEVAVAVAVAVDENGNDRLDVSENTNTNNDDTVEVESEFPEDDVFDIDDGDDDADDYLLNDEVYESSKSLIINKYNEEAKLLRKENQKLSIDRQRVIRKLHHQCQKRHLSRYNMSNMRYEIVDSSMRYNYNI